MATHARRGRKGSRTILIRSRRPSAVVDCDHIFVRAGGRVVERGTHAELLALRGSCWRTAASPFRLDDDTTTLRPAA